MRIGQIIKSYVGPKAGEDLTVKAWEYTTRKVKILAISGKGKTYTASKIAEELLDSLREAESAGEPIPVCIIDPVGHYWGLKEKFPVIVFGVENSKAKNRHADYYLTDDDVEEQAELLAMLVATTTHSVIIDLKGWTDSRQQKFGGIFADVLYRSNKHRRHVIVEEADVFIPQSVQFPDEIRCRHAFDVLVRRGRSEGLGCTRVTQRPAIVYKNVLTQADLSIVLNLADPTDIEPVDKMVRRDRDLSDDDKKEILDRITKLQKGEAFVYSPSWLGIKAFIKVYPKVAYHSGATRGDPDYREEADVLATTPPVDLDAVLSKLDELRTKKNEEAEDKRKIKDKVSKPVDYKTLATPAVDGEKIKADLRKEYENKLEAQRLQISQYYEDMIEDVRTQYKDLDDLVSVLRRLLGTPTVVSPSATTAGGPVDANIMASDVSLSVTVETKRIELSDKDPLGRIGLLIKDGFFSEKEPKFVADVYKELARRFNIQSLIKGGGKTTKPYRDALDELMTVKYGYLRRNGNAIFWTGKKVKVKETEAA